MQSQTPGSSKGAIERATFIVLAVIFLFVLRDAWVSDDAYITARTIRQWFAGNGLVFNEGERVQAYTHPLWMFLWSGCRWLTGELFFASLLLSGSLTALGLFLLTRVRGSLGVGPLLALVAFGCSRFFIDFSTSGLENPLTHLLLIVFVGQYLKVAGRPTQPSRGEWFSLALVSALLGTSRIDALVLIVPAWAYLAWGALGQRQSFRIWLPGVLLGALPLVGWEVFSLIYYGSFVPNTALAKLNTGLSRGESIQQGLIYLRETARRDYVIGALTLLAPFWAWLLALPRRVWPLWLGAVLSIAYVVSVGGDFMAGRFLLAPSLMLLLLLGQAQIEMRAVGGAVGLLVVLGVATPGGVMQLVPPPEEAKIHASGVVDERRYYQHMQSLEKWTRGRQFPRKTKQGRGFRKDAVEVLAAIGVQGTYADPSVHIVDVFALVDPLLARLPARHEEAIRVGHFQRTIPHGYIETIREGKNRFADPKLGEFYEHVKRVVSGRVWSKKRWRSIWKLQTGGLEHLIDRDAIAFAAAREVQLFAPERKAPTHGTRRAGVWVDMKRAKHQNDEVLAAVLGAAGRYRIALIDRERTVFHQDIEPSPGPGRYGHVHLVFVPKDVARPGYDRVRIYSLDDRGGVFHALLSAKHAGDHVKLTAELGRHRWVEPKVGKKKKGKKKDAPEAPPASMPKPPAPSP